MGWTGIRQHACGVCEDCAKNELGGLHIPPWVGLARNCVICWRDNVQAYAMAVCPGCEQWRDADDIVQCVPGDANSEHVCHVCRIEWAESHRWDDALGEWVECNV